MKVPSTQLLLSLGILFLASLPCFAQCPSSPTISQIQGNKLTTAAVISPCAGQTVTTSGIVTAITPTGFFIQTPDPSPHPTEGIYINIGVAATAPVVIGNNLQVTGVVSTVPLTTQSHIPGTEITVDPTSGINLISGNNPLPAPIVLTSANLSSTGSIYQLTPYEGMRVAFSSLTAVSGTGGTLDEASETYTSNGQFYAVLTTSGSTVRPFRGPGIDVRDSPVPGAPSGVAQFDDNPQRILVDSGTPVGGTPIDLASGTNLNGPSGVLDFTSSYDNTYTPARLLLDPSWGRTNVDPSTALTIQPVTAATSSQFTVASFNIDRFYNTSSSDDIYYVPPKVVANNGTTSTGATFTTTAVDVSSAAYTRRVQKTALAICNILKTPDIIALEGIENQSVANDVATQVNTTCSVSYAAFGTDNINTYTLDNTGISVGFLIKNSTVDELNFFQGGGCAAYTNPPTGCETFTPTTGSATPITSNDRPWLILTAGIKRPNAKDYPIVVIVNDLADMTGENSTTSTAVRQKKEQQAEEVSTYIQTLQANGQHVISVGNFNAFEFSDGYTDTLATYTNNNVLPSNQVVEPGKSGITTPPLTDMTLQLPDTPPDPRWSYVDNGNAEAIEHFVITSDLVSTSQFSYVHFNADFPAVDLNDATIATRVSSHDAAIGYFAIPAPVLGVFLSPNTAAFGNVTVGTSSSAQAFTLTNIGEGPVTINSIAASGDFSETNNCPVAPTTLALNASCTINVVFKPTVAGPRTGTLSALTNAGTSAATASLSGVGAGFTLTDSQGNTSTTVTTAAGSTGTSTLVFTPFGNFSGTISTTCTAQGTAPTGVTCTAPQSFALSGTAAVNQSVSFSTTSRILASGLALGSSRSPWSAALVLALAGLLMLLAGRTRRLARISGLLVLLLAIFIPAIGCSGGGGPHNNPNGTPAGSYTYAVTATSGSISATETVTLVVQ
ncbi:hypothetical protein GCM10011507_13920 [Edaphobacter acidisoli]|uniref:HYDIN/VesB/CFA65-like Ig-like domain-containing protein n=1 Tax=Edaphobacter acidisoli TaxID=2040573 RepID=A0A916RQR2_9BACT|nr:choice-of-anchor D domain-containing protein [Edaphobacter acidisoli]GGA63486.1 hypothetical protein GCM10011507_13920 [Edaphobacter acidisoli]